MISEDNVRITITIPKVLNDYLDEAVKKMKSSGFTKSVIINIALNKLLKAADPESADQK